MVKLNNKELQKEFNEIRTEMVKRNLIKKCDYKKAISTIKKILEDF